MSIFFNVRIRKYRYMCEIVGSKKYSSKVQIPENPLPTTYSDNIFVLVKATNVM